MSHQNKKHPVLIFLHVTITKAKSTLKLKLLPFSTTIAKSNYCPICELRRKFFSIFSLTDRSTQLPSFWFCTKNLFFIVSDAERLKNFVSFSFLHEKEPPFFFFFIFFPLLHVMPYQNKNTHFTFWLLI